MRGPANSEALLAAAHRLVMERGENFTTQDLIKEADVALQTFYRHFGGKDQILIAVLADLINGHCEALAAKAEHFEDPVERFRYYVVDTLTMLVANPGATARFMTSQHWRLHQLYPEELAAATKPFADLVQRELEEARDTRPAHPAVARTGRLDRQPARHVRVPPLLLRGGRRGRLHHRRGRVAVLPRRRRRHRAGDTDG